MHHSVFNIIHHRPYTPLCLFYYHVCHAKKYTRKKITWLLFTSSKEKRRIFGWDDDGKWDVFRSKLFREQTCIYGLAGCSFPFSLVFSLFSSSCRVRVCEFFWAITIHGLVQKKHFICKGAEYVWAEFQGGGVGGVVKVSFYLVLAIVT